MEQYTRANHDEIQPNRILNRWGEKVLGITETTTLRILSSKPLSYLTINGQKHVIRKEPVTDLYRAQCVQKISTEAKIVIFDSKDSPIWKGIFLPAVSQESLYIDTQSGWQLASPYTTSNPINKEVGLQSKWIWIMLLITGGFIWFIRYLYPFGNIRTQKNSTNTMI